MVNLPDDENEEAVADEAISSARSILERVTGEAMPRAKNPAAVALGRLGASKGGTARAAKLSPQEKSAIAAKAATARWRGRDK